VPEYAHDPEPAPDGLRLRSVRHAAVIYDLHPVTIRRWVYAGLISSWRVGTKVMVDLDEINARMVRRASSARDREPAK
jgi:hypothetical protein